MKKPLAIVLGVALATGALAQSDAPLVDPAVLWGERANPAQGTVSGLLGVQPPPLEKMRSDLEFRQAIDAAPARVIVLKSGRPFQVLADTYGSALLDASMSCHVVMRQALLALGETAGNGPADITALRDLNNRRLAIDTVLQETARRHGLSQAQVDTLELIHVKAFSERPLAAPSADDCKIALYPVFFDGL